VWVGAGGHNNEAGRTFSNSPITF